MVVRSSLSAPSYTDQAEELDFLVRLKHEPDDEIRRRLHRFIIEAISSPIRQLYEAESSLNYQYIENDFYTAEELAEFAERGQPPTKRNEIAPIMERLAGQFIQTRQVATFLGVNTPADDQTGAIAQDYQRHKDQQNMFEFKEQAWAWDGLIGGVGWLKKYVKKNELGQMVECEKVVNPYHVFLDPYSTEYDPNEDAKYIVEGPWMDLEDCIALFPDKEDEIRADIHGWGGHDMPYASQVAASLQNESQLTSAIYAISVQATGTRRRVRPFEVWHKRKIRVFHLFTPDGVLALPVPLDSKTAKDVIRELGNQVVAVPHYQDRMYVGVMLGNLVLHYDVSPHETNLFPYVPFYSGRRKNGAPLPIASRLVPINESINKRESKALALLTNRQIIAERGALEDEDEFATEVARPDGVGIVKDGALANKRVIIRDNLEIGQGQMALLQEDKDAMRRVSGQGAESMGMPSEVRSGSGIARKQMMGNLIVTPIHNHLRYSRHMRARLSFALMKQYLTEEIAFQITDDPNAARTVQITKGHIQAIKERTYDVVITETKDYTTLREQQAEMLLTVLPQLANLGPGYVKLGIQLTEFRDKEGLMRMVDQQSQPAPPQPKMSITMAWPDMTPEMQAFVALTQWQSPELAEAIMKKGDDPAFVQKIKAKLIETQVREGTRATVERGKLDLSALSTAVEGRLQLRQVMEKSMPEQEGAMPQDQSMEGMQ